MTLREICEFAVNRGMDLDPRGREALERQLRERAEEFAGLEGKARDLFDQERMRNPFGDTRLVTGDPGTEVRRMVVGIEIGVAEVLLAEALRQKGEPVDAIWSHHTSGIGPALADIEDTMWVQVHLMVEAGVARHVAEKLVRADMAGRSRGQDFRVVQVADALGIPIVGIHAPPDLYNLRYLRDLIEGAKPERAGELVEVIQDIPECRWLHDRGTPVRAVVGDERDGLGRLYLVMAGGWNPSPASFEALCEAGVGTFVLVATSAELNAIAARHHASIVVYPHWPADSAGMNLLLDDLCRTSPIEVVPVGEYIRARRGTGRVLPGQLRAGAVGGGGDTAVPGRGGGVAPDDGECPLAALQSTAERADSDDHLRGRG